MHPHKFTLDILKQAIEKAPPVFPEDRRKIMLVRCEELLADKHVSLEEIEQALIAFGKEIWPCRKAFEKMYEKYNQEGEGLVKSISDGRQTEYQELFDKFKQEGEKIESQIQELRKLAETYPQLAEEILDSIRVIEEGFSVVERDVSLFDVKKKIEYYKGRLGLL